MTSNSTTASLPQAGVEAAVIFSTTGSELALADRLIAVISPD